MGRPPGLFSGRRCGLGLGRPSGRGCGFGGMLWPCPPTKPLPGLAGCGRGPEEGRHGFGRLVAGLRVVAKAAEDSKNEKGKERYYDQLLYSTPLFYVNMSSCPYAIHSKG